MILTREQSEKAFMEALHHSILLKNVQKRQLAKAMKAWPGPIVLWMTEKLEDKNKSINEYIDIALANDKEGKYLREFKKIFKTIREQADKLDQKVNQQHADDLLEEEIESM